MTELLSNHNLGIVNLMTPEKGRTDILFTANLGLFLGDNVIPSRFYHKERQGEDLYFKK